MSLDSIMTGWVFWPFWNSQPKILIPPPRFNKADESQIIGRC